MADEKKMYRVKTYGIEKEYPELTQYLEIAQEFQDREEEDIVLAVVDGRLQELHKRLKKNCEIRFLTTKHSLGNLAYRRSAVLLMLKAAYYSARHMARKLGLDEAESRIVVHYSLSQGYYCTVEGGVPVNEEFLKRTEKKMREIIAADMPIMKRSTHTDEAIALFRSHKMHDKEKLFHYRRVSKVNIYSIDDFEDYYYGYMVPSTRYLRYFSLHLYDEGFVLQLPRKDQPCKVPPFRPQHKVFQTLKESTQWGNMVNVSTVADLNEKITSGKIKDLILIQEALQEKKIAELAQDISGKKEKKFIMIAGPSSSGKTTFSHRLSIQLAAHGLNPHPIAVDNYFINRDETPLDEFGQHDFECLEAIDIELFNRDMSALLEGKEIELPYYNFKTGKREYRGECKKLGKEDILVIEGIHCLNDKLSSSLPQESKYKIYISALAQLNIDEHNRIPTTDGRLIRRMVRDARTRGTSAKETIDRWASVRRGEEKHIFPYQECADVMFNSALIYELAALKIYAEPVLFGIKKTEPEYQEAKRLLKFLDYFVGIPSENIPTNSILREFVGGGCFHD